MTGKETIHHHEGIVEHVGAESCLVRIRQASACSSCSARQLCHSSESREKIIEVSGSYPTLRVGDNVILTGSVHQGLRASVFAYIVPLILMLAVLFVCTHLGGEAAGAVAALSVLVIYYGILYLLRKKLGKEFVFRIES